MALLGTDRETISRRAVILTWLMEGAIGLGLLAWTTVARSDETRAILSALGRDAVPLVTLFLALTISAALLKFKMTEKVFVTFTLTACTAMLPLLGTVISAWIVVVASVSERTLGLMGIGPNRITSSDRPLEYARAFGLVALYGIPVIVAGFVFGLAGGTVPLREAGATPLTRAALAALAMQGTNNVLMLFVERAYGYGWRKIGQTNLFDHMVFVLTVPYALVIAISYTVGGLWMVLGLAFTGVVMCAVLRKLALTMTERQELVERLSSLTTIGRMISLDRPQGALLETIYQECRKVLDTSQFAIALVDEDRAVLRFELYVADGRRHPAAEVRLGEGLSSWVVDHREPLLMSNVAEDEARLGLTHVDDGLPSDGSWLGVPMIAREQVIGLVVVQSPRRSAFDESDVVLLTAIANQAAIALENAALYQNLERKVEERTTEIAEKVRQLELSEARALDASKAKGRFLAHMSHELRTPLNAILGFVQLMERTPNRTTEDRDNLKVITRSGQHLLSLINDVLSMAKIEAGKQTRNDAPFDLQRLLGDLESLFHVRSEETGLPFDVRSAADVPRYVTGDEGKIRQVLVNLLGNAFKFTQRGQVLLDVERENGSLRFTVADTGPGLSRDEIDLLTQPFVQAESGRRSREGTGLGLAISRSFVTLMGGDLRIESTPGRGSRFSFALPLATAEVVDDRADPGRVISLDSTGRPPCVLVAEDRPESRAFLVRLLRSVGFIVAEASNGREAVDTWRRIEPELILMDIQMPVMEGDAAAMEIRREEEASRRPRTPIVALTAGAFEHQKETLLASGCDDFVAKPFLDATIFDAIARNVGVTYRYDEREKARPARSGDLDFSALATIDPVWLEALHTALACGDVEDAARLADEIEEEHGPVAVAMRKMIRAYRLDDLEQAVVAARGPWK